MNVRGWDPATRESHGFEKRVCCDNADGPNEKEGSEVSLEVLQKSRGPEK